MEMQNKSLKICHLYPNELNLFGANGNVNVLKARAEMRGISVDIVDVNIGDEIFDADIYFIGSGQDKQQFEVSMELQKYKEFLLQKRDDGKVFLSICGGFQLLGNYYQDLFGNKLDGIGLLDVYTIEEKKRFTGHVTATIDYLEPSTFVGFENHSARTFLTNDTKSMATVTIGNGNNGKDFTEGARFKNVFGTYLDGSFLPKNPHFADYLLQLALQNKYGEDITLPQLNDKIEWLTHNSLVNKPY